MTQRRVAKAGKDELLAIMVALALFVVAVSYFSVPLALTDGVWFSTDQWDFIGTAETLRSDLSFVAPSPMNDAYGTVIFDSHQYPYVSRLGGQVSQYPPGQALVLAALRTVIPNYNVVACVIAALGVVATFLLLRHLYGLRVAVMGAVILVTTPIYAFYALPALADSTAFTILVLALLSYLKATEPEGTAPLWITALLLGVAVWFKYVNVVLALPFAVHYAWTRGWRGGLRPLIGAGIVYGLVVGTLLAYNAWAFGGPFHLGYGYLELPAAAEAGEPVQVQAASNVFARFANLPIREGLIRLVNMPVLMAICAPIALVGVFAVPRVFGSARGLPLILLVAGTVAGFYLLITGHTYGTDDYDRLTFSSFNRYLLPAYCLLMVPALLLVRDVSRSRLAVFLALATAFNLASAWLATTNLSNLNWHIPHQRATQALRERHLELIPEGAPVLGCSLAFYLQGADRPIVSCRAHIPRWVVEVERVVQTMLDGGRDVYQVGEFEPPLTLPGVDRVVVDADTAVFRLVRSADPVPGPAAGAVPGTGVQ